MGKYNVGDRLISYRVIGDFKKEPLLMLCGLGMPMSSWGGTAKRFAKNFTVVTWDYPGLGKSTKLNHQYTTLDLAHDSAALLNHLSVSHVHVLGYSMGGIVAQQLAVTYKGLVRKIAFLASTPLSNSMSWINPAAQAEMIKALNEDPSKLIRVLIKYAFNKPINRQIYGLVGRLYAAAADSDVLTKMFKATAGQETWSNLPNLSAQAAFALNGSEDNIINYDAGAALAQRIPNCTSDLIVGGSHSLLQEFKTETEEKLHRFFIS